VAKRAGELGGCAGAGPQFDSMAISKLWLWLWPRPETKLQKARWPNG
jgi:hypothetical protein